MNIFEVNDAAIHRNGRPTRYREIADAISGQIKGGVLRAGERSPSVREICRRFKVSASTAVEACVLLENRRLIEARPKSGFYVRSKILDNVPLPSVSRPEKKAKGRNLSEILNAMYHASADKKCVDLGAAVPSHEYFPMKKLAAISSSVSRNQLDVCVNYDMSPGFPELRRVLARRLFHIGCPISPSEIIVTCGCTEAIAIALRSVTKPGDIVAVESPSYFGTLQALKHYGLRLLEIATDPQTGMRLDALEQAIGRHKISAVAMVTNFNNPLGSCPSAEAKEKLVSLLAKHQIPLIEDDIYGDIHFGEERPVPAKAFDRKGLVLYCTSFSKTIAPGYRIGFIAPGSYYDEAVQIKRELTLGNASLQQLVLAEFLKHGGYDAHLRKIRREYSSLVSKYSEVVARHFPEGIRISRPRGGFVIWVEVPESVDAVDLAAKALRHHISIAPGRLFSPKGHFSNFIRINCARKWSAEIERSLEILGRLVGSVVN